MKTHTPGLHILATFTAPTAQLTDADGCRACFNGLIAQLGLTKVGEVYYSFPNNSFTAVVCLTESHVSIHTWPEFSTATFDVFLSNFQEDNSEKVRTFYNETLAYFGASVISLQEVSR